VPRWIPAVPVDDVDLEDGVPFSHEGVDYAIYRSGEGEFYATDGHCTHERQLLCDGLVMGTIVECPKHNGRFDYRTGAAKGAPVLVDVRTYPTRVTDGLVQVEIDSS
jgi:3-phenylpropionate/trans-cinnamate dioxygenase ferredoxin component